jgi:hypothetical protein
MELPMPLLKTEAQAIKAIRKAYAALHENIDLDRCLIRDIMALGVRLHLLDSGIDGYEAEQYIQDFYQARRNQDAHS